MIKLSAHCGICRFSFSNANEKSLLEIALKDDIDSNGLLVSAPRLSYSIKGQTLDGNTFIANYEGATGEVLEMNNLTYDLINKRVVKTNALKHNLISNNNIILGLLTCDSVIKKFNGIYNLKQNTTEVFGYETY
jgi:hypothetical protein